MKKIFKNHWPILVLAVFCLLLISIWFKDGKLLATGEEGLILANPLRSIELYKYSWNEIGPGNASPGVNPMIPLLYLESHIINAGVPIWLFQATIFFLLMSIGSCSIYYLSKELFKNLVQDNLKVRLALITAIFYILNPISLLGVWYRFALSFEFFYALAPLFFYLFIIGLNRKKLIFVLFIPLVSLFFSFAFAAPALPLLIWVLPFIYSLVLFWLRPYKNEPKFKIYPLIYFTLMFIFWLLINLWWIFPYAELSRIAFASETSPIHAIGTLKANSRDFTITNVIRLIHGGFLYRGEAFGSIYKTPFFLFLSWLIPIIVIYGLFKLKHGQIKRFFTLSLISLLFLVKGVSPPFGSVFLWFFTHITFLQVYRNPLEKIGMLLPIVYAPLFSVGLLYLLSKIRNSRVRKISLIVAILCLSISNWPFFTGAMVTFEKRDIRVTVPSSFQNANKAVPTGGHIFFSLPQMGGGSGRYKWPYGYAGVESSEYLFNYPTIVKFYDAPSFFAQLLIGSSQGKMESNLVGLAQIFSADVIVFRKDTDLLAFGDHSDTLNRSERMINQSNLTKIFDSPEVSLWTLPKEKIVPVIYVPKSIRFGDSPAELISLIEDSKFNPQDEVFLCINTEKCIPNYELSKLQQTWIEAVPDKIEFEKILPTRYDIKVVNSRGKFLLVFNNTYHPGWVALVNSKPIPTDQHIIANGYANGFIIDEEGKFNISLQFAPEEKILKTYKISLSAILLGMVTLLVSAFMYLTKRIFSYQKA